MLWLYRFAVPQTTPTPKGLSNLNRPSYLCGGLINHYNNNKNLFISEEYKQNSNLVLSVLYYHLFTQLSQGILQLLVACNKYIYLYIYTGTTRSKNLHIQVDNCSGQNKNRYFMAFCSFLVLIDWFVSVELSFLITGIVHGAISTIYFFTRTYTHWYWPIVCFTKIPFLQCNSIYFTTTFTVTKFRYLTISKWLLCFVD